MAILVFISLIFLVNTSLKCLGEENDGDTVTLSVNNSAAGSGSDFSLECLNAQLYVAAIQPCFKAIMKIGEQLPYYRLPLSDNLRELCSPSCRRLNLHLSDACLVRLNLLYASTRIAMCYFNILHCMRHIVMHASWPMFVSNIASYTYLQR